VALPNFIAGLVELRLAVVSPFVDRRHGTERALAELLERLARDYHCEIHLYAERVEDLAVTHTKTPRACESGGIVWHKVPSIAGPHLVKFLGWMIANSFLRGWHRVFHGLSFDLVLSPGINCWNADVIIVHVVFQRLRELSLEKTAGEAPQPRSLRDLHRRAYYGLLTALERRLYSNRKTLLAAVSQRTANLLTQYFRRDDVRVIPNGVDTREFCESNRAARREQARRRLNLCDTDFVLLLIGNDWRVKGLLTILEAMAQLPVLPLHLLVVGNDAAEIFRQQAKRLGVLDRCHWERPHPEVIDFYASADVYVSPSREDSFGLPVAEAMACGLLVITSSQAGVSALVRDGIDGFVLPDPQDPQHLASIIRQLYADSALRQTVGAAAAKTAQDWTWDRSAAEVWSLLIDSAAVNSPKDIDNGKGSV
jgi:UDP-glucose:(heptosyl)LPS alpha-1,3-glucosyltransferase